MIAARLDSLIDEIQKDERILERDLHEQKRARLLEDIRRMRMHLATLERQVMHENDDFRGDCC